MSLLKKIQSPNDIKTLNGREISELAEEIRSFLVENVLNCGGHLASNLGVVELMLAIFKNFDFDKDKIIFDVGHQCYVYKMLTHRLDGFSSLRHLGGISGFPRTSESKYDFFDVGHAGTSISVSVGMARARDLIGGDEHIIAFVGDGALTSGMSFEALNDVGLKHTNLIIILNDNEMSIDKNVGGLSAHLSRLRFASRYINTKSTVHGLLNKFGIAGKNVGNAIRFVKDKVKYATIASPLFEQLGISYMGIIDGNDFECVSEALKRAKNIDGPVIIHTCTKKGLGYKEAENNPDKFHGVGSNTAKLSPKDISYDDVFSAVISNLAKENKGITAITAAMASGCGLSEFSKEFPDRFFDVGIAEEHAVTMAAGMAKRGLSPVVCVYSTFLQRAYDQLVHDVCLQNLHVVLAIGHAGLTGEDGETHQGLLDLSMLSHIPNMTVLCPSSYDELKIMLEYAIRDCTGPVAVRYPKCSVSFRKSENLSPILPELIEKGEDLTILSCGRMAETAVEASRILKKKGINASVVNLRAVKPLDIDALNELIRGKKCLVTIEDNITDGGMGQYVSSKLMHHVHTLCLGFDTCFIPHGKQEELIGINGLDACSVAQRIEKFYKGLAD